MKAKRIVSFCSLFSLVLILSVYYVLSPVSLGNGEVVNENIDEGDGEIVELVDGETAYFDNLEVLKQTAFINEIKELESIVASATSSMEEKINALEVKSNKTKINEKEKELVTLIKSKGYDNVYVEYEDNKINVLVGKKDSNKTDALTIIRTIYPSLEAGYTPVVTFKS